MGVGLLAVLARRFMAVLSVEQSGYEELMGRMVNAYTDALAGRRTIRAAGTVDREIDRVTQPLPALAATTRNILRVMGRAAVVMASADTGVLVATAVAGIWLLASGDLTPGALLAAVRYAQMAYGNAAGVFDNGWFHIALLRSQAARVMELVDTPAMTQGSSEAPTDGGLGDIELDGVSVRGEADDILRGVNLQVPTGTTIALVGESGVGKTTLATLVGRLHDPDEGTVRIDGTPLVAWSAEALAKRVAYAFESPALLGDTVRERSRSATTPATPRFRPLREAWRRTHSSGACRTATIRPWTRRRCRGANGNAWAWRAPRCVIPRRWCWTTR